MTYLVQGRANQGGVASLQLSWQALFFAPLSLHRSFSLRPKASSSFSTACQNKFLPITRRILG
jgi:hypothetical protein